MNNLNKDLITQTLQELLQENPNLLCFTDHRHLNILSWKSKKVPHAQIVKIGDKRFIGFIRKDRNGESYWKYQPITENSPSVEETSQNPSSPNQPTSEAIQKFQQRQEKAQQINYERTENHQSS